MVAIKDAMYKRSFDKKADSLGITFSALCILHCVSLPVILSFSALSSITSIIHELYYIEYLFLFLAFTAIYYASKRSKTLKIKLGFWITFIILVISFYMHEYNNIAKIVSVLSSTALIFLHILNIRSKKNPNVRLS